MGTRDISIDIEQIYDSFDEKICDNCEYLFGREESFVAICDGEFPVDIYLCKDCIAILHSQLNGEEID